MGYVDDVYFIAPSHRAFFEAFKKIKNKAMRVVVNEGKQNIRNIHHSVDSYNFEVFKDFVYLAANVNSRRDISVEIRRGIILANR